MTNESQAPASCCSTSPAQEATAPEAPAASGCCGTTSAANPAADAAGRGDLLAGGEDTATCPVMVGTPVVKAVAEAQGLFRDHEGQRYWFCCASCGPAFDSDPAKYAANAA